MDANNFWEVMETNEVSKDEIVLLTSYLIDTFRKQGFNLPADKFLKEAKVEVVEELEGSLVDYHELWMKHGAGLNAWIFFCQEKLKLKGLKEDTSQAISNQQLSPCQERPRLMRHSGDIDQTTTHQQPFNVHQDQLFSFPCQERPWLTTTNQQRLKVDPDKDTISGPKKEALMKLFRYISKYFNRHALLADCFVKKDETNEAQPSAGSRKRKCDFLNVKV